MMEQTKCTCDPHDEGHDINCARVVELQLDSAKKEVKRLRRKLDSALEKYKTVIYECSQDEEISLGSFFNDVKEKLDEGAHGIYIKFAIIDNKVCIVTCDEDEE